MSDSVDYRVETEQPIVTLIIDEEGWGSIDPATDAGVEIYAHSGSIGLLLQGNAQLRARQSDPIGQLQD